VVNASVASLLIEERGSGCDSASVSMHTGQIILLTKMLSETDLGSMTFRPGSPCIHGVQRNEFPETHHGFGEAMEGFFDDPKTKNRSTK
jgi:hypothetical protein